MPMDPFEAPRGGPRLKTSALWNNQPGQLSFPSLCGR